MEWQPIETAPKDRRSRLVWCPENKNVYCVYWEAPKEQPCLGKWAYFGGTNSELIDEPTHWMPLPNPPE